MPSSLDALSNNLTDDQYKNTNRYYSGEHFKLLRKKGVYPYEWTNFERLSATELPSKNEFYSRLAEEGISDDDYAHAQNVWKTFGCKTFMDYHDLYNVSDVLLLADIFETFRDTCMKNYKLDPAWYYTSPGLSWDAMLKMTKIELELLYLLCL